MRVVRAAFRMVAMKSSSVVEPVARGCVRKTLLLPSGFPFATYQDLCHDGSGECYVDDSLVEGELRHRVVSWN